MKINIRCLMKVILLVVNTLFLISCSSESHSTIFNCSILKSGVFKYIDYTDTSSYIVINGNDHVEYFNSKRYYIKSRLKWIGDCEYEMTIVETTLPKFQFRTGDKLHVKIIKIEKEFIYYTSSGHGQDFEGVLMKIE